MSAARTLARRLPGLRRAVRTLRRVRAAARDRPPVALLDDPRHAISVHVASPAVAHSRLHPVAKEPWTVAWLEQRLGPEDVVWDVGANIGGYSLIAAVRGAQVVAIEPSSANFAALCDNIALNGFGDRIVPLPVVLAAATALAELEHADSSAGATHRVAGEAASGYRQPSLGFALDDLIARFDLPSPSLLKLDVDGAEAQVLAGARATLGSSGLRSVLIEIETAVEDEVVGLMQAAGWVVAERHAERDGEPLKGVWYGVFERP